MSFVKLQSSPIEANSHPMCLQENEFCEAPTPAMQLYLVYEIPEVINKFKKKKKGHTAKACLHLFVLKCSPCGTLLRT